jgi:tetratricopeptide (TPR) repeat protein
MLFDLQSPGRKTAVRIIFGFLAFLFLIGFIGFGVGGTGGGGILDSITGGGGSTDDAFKQQIEDAEADIDADPSDSEAIASLILLRAQSGDAQLETDDAGNPVGLSDESRDEYEEAISRWQDYLDTDPKKINPAAAGAVVQSYQFLGDIDGAIAAQRALAESDPSAPNLGALASFLYSNLDIEAADKARDKALAQANAETKKLITQQLAQIRKQAVKAQKEQKKQPDSATGESPELSDPFGGLNPTDPATPTP